MPVKDGSSIQLDSLAAGTYKLEYTNLFDQRIQKLIPINANTTVTLYVDSLRDYSFGLLEVLEDDEWLELRLDRMGVHRVTGRKNSDQEKER